MLATNLSPRLTLCLAVAVGLSGCSIHPTPNDVTRDAIVDIVNKIRCEARDAVIAQIVDVIEEIPSPQNTKLLSKLKKNGTSERVIARLNDNEVDSTTLKRIQRFKDSGISYKFLLTITEMNSKSAGANFRLPFKDGTFRLGLSAGADKTRAAEREFKLTDTFSSLATGLDAEAVPTGLDCGWIDQPRKRWIYPITGNIGLAEVIDTFIEIEKTSGTLDTYTDKLTFTTMFGGAVNPSVTLNPPAALNRFKLANASLSLGANRSDEHQVLVALTKPSEPTVKKDEEYLTLFSPTKVVGLPAGTEVGLTVKVPKSMVPGARKITRTQRSRRTMGTLFSTTKRAETIVRQEGRAVLDRADSLSRQRDLNTVIGR